MIAWENLLTGFGFRFRSLLNLAVSSYLLASILQHRGYGESGFSNLASVARSFQLVALGDWIENTYQSLKSGIPEGQVLVSGVSVFSNHDCHCLVSILIRTGYQTQVKQ